MSFDVASPLALLLLPLALAPLFFSALRPSSISSVAAAPRDALSSLVAWTLRVAAMLAISACALAVAGPFREGRAIARYGEGAEISILIDRSASMNETFAGRTPAGGEESKASAAKRIMSDFVARRAHDLFGVTAFSTSPILVMPMTDHRDAVRAAIRAIDRPGLGYTNIGRGLAMALSQFPAGGEIESRVILLVSDGAAVIDPRIQDQLRADFRKIKPNLYWLFLRTQGSKGLSDKPGADELDTPQALPERHLDLFFKSLGVGYRAFEAEGPAAVAEAIGEIDRLERRPFRYAERIPRKDLTDETLLVAAFATFLLVAAKFAETSLKQSARADAPRARARRLA
ncbi:VWA domain-containing protein [Methylosinus sporium]|uniref:VWA domain-containing protein n=1 Tax=Methylosinus sporium TaxID=428 RepID=A0A549T2X8_METSR|nr:MULTISPECIES: vWA domain-containing protein [Methylosinus]MBU3889496.1 VWA domain-containing protein [Methylosinus sp. KRF6]TRL36225.1 VWA domain-containing protein [Methylosinus sporium]